MKALLSRLKNALPEWLDEWQELLFWLPILVLLLLGLRHALPYVDPRSAFDGWSSFLFLVSNVISGVVAVFMAWLCRRTYHQLAGSDRVSMDVLRGAFDRVDDNTSLWRAVGLWAMDRADSAFWILVWLWIVFGRS